MDSVSPAAHALFCCRCFPPTGWKRCAATGHWLCCSTCTIRSAALLPRLPASAAALLWESALAFRCIFSVQPAYRTWGIAAVSRILAGYKLLLSAYLIFTAFLTARKSEKNHRLFYVSLLFRLCLPLGSYLSSIRPDLWRMVSGMGLHGADLHAGYDAIGKFLAESYTQNRLLQQQNHNAEKQLIMQTNYTFQLREQVEIRRRFVHDFRHHLRTLHTLAEQTGDQVILEYLDSVGEYSSGSGKNHGNLLRQTGSRCPAVLL